MYQKSTMPCLAGIALALLLLAGSSVRADLIQWGYNWEPSASQINATSGGSGHLTLSDGASNAAAGTSNTVVTNLRAFSTATSGDPATFTNAGFNFSVQLKDLASSATGTATFTGFFSGTMTADSANIKANFTSATTQTLTLGGNTYTVALGTYSPPGPPGAVNAGSLNATVSVAQGNGNGHTSSTPEPSALLLAGLAFPCLGLNRWRRRKTANR